MRVENGKKVFSVREVNSYIGNIIKNDYLLKNICFEGEVSSFSKGPTGHLYITLKDCTAPGDLPEGAPYNGILRVNVWKSVAAKLNLTTVKQGDILIVKGSCSIYDAKSEYSVNAVSVQRREERGWHGEAYAELKRRLGQEGIFDTAIKKPIPKYPRAVGVVISIGTNAYKDIMSVSHRRNPYVQMIVCDARAQGENARELIVQGIRRLDRMGVDTIIIGRGPVASGHVTFYPPDGGKEKELVGLDPMKIRKSGISMSFVPEDRLGMGLVGSMGMTGNMMLRSWRKGKGLFLNRKDPEALANRIWEELGVVTPSTSFPVRRMSGGNVQKVLVGREIAQSPAVLMTAYAVRGLDINTSYTIYNLLTEQKMHGVAVVYVGEDLDVLLELCDRIVVLCGGQVSGVVDARKTDKREVGALMTLVRGGNKDE